MTDDRERCKDSVWDGWTRRRCSRKAWKDGYCKQHHPDSVKRRREESERRYEERWRQNPVNQLSRRVKQLEDFIEAHGLIVPPVKEDE
jgi:hypothetical protein